MAHGHLTSHSVVGYTNIWRITTYFVSSRSPYEKDIITGNDIETENSLEKLEGEYK